MKIRKRHSIATYNVDNIIPQKKRKKVNMRWYKKTFGRRRCGMCGHFYKNDKWCSYFAMPTTSNDQIAATCVREFAVNVYYSGMGLSVFSFASR